MKHFVSLLLLLLLISPATSTEKTPVYLIKTTDRVAGIEMLLKKIDLSTLSGKKIVIKPNFNSNDPFPATTHLDTIKTVIKALKTVSPESITIVERSGMGNTEKVLTNRGVYTFADKEKIAVVNLDNLKKEDWVIKGKKGTHWRKGFPVPKVVLEADYVINLPCLKTHRFGGDFTMSLKNNVGLVAKWHGAYNYMWELHGSPNQRLMIAEINKYIPSNLIILDGIKGFSTQGPEKGKIIKPGIIMLATDPIAIDAVGVAILRMYGTTEKVSSGRIFDQEQIKRAAELDLGVKSVNDIELVPLNKEAEQIVNKISKNML